MQFNTCYTYEATNLRQHAARKHYSTDCCNQQQQHRTRRQKCRIQQGWQQQVVCIQWGYSQSRNRICQAVQCQANASDDVKEPSPSVNPPSKLQRVVSTQQRRPTRFDAANSTEPSQQFAANNTKTSASDTPSSASVECSDFTRTRSPGQSVTANRKQTGYKTAHQPWVPHRHAVASTPGRRSFTSNSAVPQSVNLSFKTTPNPAQLSRLIKQCYTIGQLTTVVHNYHQHMDGINFSACIHRCATLSMSAQKRNPHPKQDSSINTLDQASLPCIEMTDLQFDPGGQPDSILSYPVRKPHYKQQNSNQKQTRDDIKRLIGQLLPLLSAHLEELHWRELSSALWSLATVSMIPAHQPGQDIVAMLLGHMESRGFETADSQSLSNSVWAVGKLGIRPDQQWMDSCLQAVMMSAGVFEAQHLSNTLWGVAAIGHTPGHTWIRQFWVHVHNAMPSKQQLIFLYPRKSQQQASDNQPTAQQQGLRPTKYQLVQMQQYANLLYASACLGYVPGNNSTYMLRFWNNTLALILSELYAIQQEQTTATRMTKPPPIEATVTAEVNDQSTRQMLASTVTPTGDHQDNIWRPERLLPRHSVMLLLATARMNIDPPVRWWNVFAQLLTHQIPTMTPQELSNTIYAYGKIASNTGGGKPGGLPNKIPGVAAGTQHMHPPVPPAEVLQQLCAWAFKRRRGMTAQGIANILWAVARLHVLNGRQQRHPSRMLRSGQRDGTGIQPSALPGGMNRGWVSIMVQTVCQNDSVTVNQAQQRPTVHPGHGQQQQQQQQQQPKQQGRTWQPVSSFQQANKQSAARQQIAVKQQASTVDSNHEKHTEEATPNDIGETPIRHVGWNMIGSQHQQSNSGLSDGKGRVASPLQGSVSQDSQLTTARIDGRNVPLQTEDAQGVSPQAIGNIIWALGVLNVDPGAQSIRLLLQRLGVLIQNGMQVNFAVKQQLLHGCAKLRYTHLLEQYVSTLLEINAE